MSSENIKENDSLNTVCAHFSTCVNNAKLLFKNILLNNLQSYAKVLISFYPPQT